MTKYRHMTVLISFVITSIMISPSLIITQGASNGNRIQLGDFQNDKSKMLSNEFESDFFNGQIAIIIGDESEEVNIAFSYVQDNIPNKHYRIIDTFEEARNYKFLIIIAHGNKDGLQLRESEISWEDVGLTISDSSILQVFTFACDGSLLSQYVSENIKLISFEGGLDAIIGGLLAATVISLLTNLNSGYLFDLLFERVKNIEEGKPMIELGKYYRSDANKIYKKIGFIKIHIDTSGYVDWLYTGTHVASWAFEMVLWSAVVGFGNVLLGFIVATYAWWIETSSGCNSFNGISYGIHSRNLRGSTDLNLNCDEPYPYPYPTTIPLPVPGLLWIDIMDNLFDTNGNWYWMLS